MSTRLSTRLSAAALLASLLLAPCPSAWSQQAPAPEVAADVAARPARLDALGDPLPEAAQARYGHTRLRHESEPAELRFDAEARAVTSRAARGGPRRWSVDDGRALAALTDDASLPADLADDVAAGRARVAPAGDGRSWFRWSFDERPVQLRRPGADALSFDPDGRAVVDGAFDPGADVVFLAAPRIASREDFGSWVARFDVSEQEPAWEIELPDMVPVQVLAIPAGEDRPATVVVTSRGGEVALLDADSGTALVRWQAHDVELGAASLAPGGALATAGVDGELALWALRAEPELLWRQSAHVGAVGSLAASAELDLLASGGRDHRVRLWSLGSGQPLELPPTHAARLTRAARDAASGRVVTSDWTGRLGFWDGDGDHRAWVDAAHRGRVTGLRLFDSLGLALSAGQDGELALWSLATGEAVGRRQITEAAVLALAATDDGLHVATSGGDAQLRLWTLQQPAEGPAFLRAVAEVPAGPRAAFALAYLPDGSGLVVASSEVRLMDADTGEDRWSTPVGAPVAALSVSPDGSRVAAALASRTVVVLAAEDGRELWRWSEHPGRVTAVAFAPDGNRLAAAGGDALVRVRGMGDDETLELDGHVEEVVQLGWHADGSLLSASADGTAVLWRP